MSNPRISKNSPSIFSLLVGSGVHPPFFRTHYLFSQSSVGFSRHLPLPLEASPVRSRKIRRRCYNPSSGGSSKATERGYFGAAGLATAFALSAILDTQFSLRVGRLQLHVRAAIVSAVYRLVVATKSPPWQYDVLVACRYVGDVNDGSHKTNG